MKKPIALFLAFSILVFSGNLFANERKGAELIIHKIDRTQVRGELIAVKENSLLLLDRDSGVDVTIEIVDIQAIKIKKKSQLLGWSVAGLLGGTAVGFLIGNSLENNDPNKINILEGYATAIGTIAGAAIGLLVGVVVGLSTKGAKTIQIVGKSDSEIQEILEELRKKARIKNAQ